MPDAKLARAFETLREAASGRPCLGGSFDFLTPGEVLSLLYGSLRTGVLVAQAAGKVSELHLRDGEVAGGRTSDKALRLGPVLVDAGWLDAAAYAEIEPLVAPARKLGKLLTERGLLDAADLYRGIVLQMERIVVDLVGWEAGTFLFSEGPIPADSSLKLSRRTRELCLEGLRLKVAPAPEPSEKFGSAPAKYGPFDIYRAIFANVFATLKRDTGVAQEGLNSFFLEAPAPYAALFEGLSFGSGGELDIERMLARAGGDAKGPLARARTLEALDTLLAFVLFEARNALPSDASEQLLREVGRLQLGGGP